ncbi:MAG: aminotransferase class V-fold PLP-dependent enzyme, partial [Mesorhizobium sp.]
QAVGRIPIDLANALAEVDLLSFSAHKFHGPKGIGGLFMRDGVAINALISGEQEKGLRGGTSNVPGAAGLAVAARLAALGLSEMAKVAQLRDQLEARLLALRPTGSACRAGATAPSHVLTAMGVSLDDARATLRFSLSVKTTQDEVDRTITAIEPLLRSTQ